MIPKKINVIVDEVVEVNELIKRFVFKRTDGEDFPLYSGGSHIVVEMDDNGITHRNAYSLMSDPNDASHYSISVRRDDEGRGGSLFMHNKVVKGSELQINYPANLFALDMRAKKHLMLAGGIGITPFIAQIKQLNHLKLSEYELHYAVRNKDIGAYVDELTDRYPHHVHVYVNEDEQRIDLDNLLSNQPAGTHLYVCGPKGMIDWVLNSAEAAGWPREAVHFEEFLTPEPGEPFTAELVESGMTIEVGEHQSLLEAMEAAGVNPPYLCRGGACGQCETEVVACDGTILHQDHWLTEEQHATNKVIMPCVSRFEGKKITIKR